jgi:hypothetical protein
MKNSFFQISSYGMKGNRNPGIILGGPSKKTDKMDYLAALGEPVFAL